MATKTLRSQSGISIGGKMISLSQLEDPLALIELSSHGLPVDAVKDFTRLSQFDSEMVAGFMDVSTKTLTRYSRQNKTFSPRQSEYLLKLFLAFIKGQQVFGNLDEFRAWLQLPAYGLAGHVPARLLMTPQGVDLILDELSRIAHGDLA